MKDGFDITIDVAKLLNVSAITTLLGPTGKIYQTERPAGRTTFTDIVINALGITNTNLQKGSGNVNCYVPVLTSKLSDQAKLMTLSRAVIALIDEHYATSFQTWIDDSQTIMQDTDGSYFVNIPFEYQAYNKDYKNI